MSAPGLVWDDSALAADLAIVANDIATDRGLETAVLRSLFEDRRAELSDTLPVGVSDRRGWWADAFPVVEGDKVGSRLWLLARENNTASVLARAERYAKESLAWLLEDRVASVVEVAASPLGATGFLLTITIHRPGRDPAQFRYGRAWQAQAERN